MLMISFITASIGLAALILALVYCARRPNRVDIAFVLLAGAAWLLALRIGVTSFSWQTGTALHIWFKRFSLIAGFFALMLIPLSAVALTVPRRRSERPKAALLALFILSCSLLAVALVSLFPFMKPFTAIVREWPEIAWLASCALIVSCALATLAQDRERLKKDGSLVAVFTLIALASVCAALPTLFRLLSLDPDYLPLLLSIGFSLVIFAASPGIMRRDATRAASQPITPHAACNAAAPNAAAPNTAEGRSVDPMDGAEPIARGAVIRTATPLSARETEIASLLSEGRTNSEIAELLFISQKTVETHLSNIFRKMRVSNRVQLVRALLAPTPEKIHI